MTHKYLYIEESSNVMGECTRYYIVMLKISKQADRDYLFLMAHAAENGHYFSIWNRITAEFVSNIIANYPGAQSKFIRTDARSLVKHFKAGTRPSLIADTLRNINNLRKITDTCFRLSSNINLHKHE